MGTYRKLAVTFGLAVSLVGISASAAGAGQPAIRACVGKTFSQATAHPLGQLVSSFARDPFSKPGLGDGIQLIQAGLVPDAVVPNACNG
jgi:hypothetical protein